MLPVNILFCKLKSKPDGKIIKQEINKLTSVSQNPPLVPSKWSANCLKAPVSQ